MCSQDSLLLLGIEDYPMFSDPIDAQIAEKMYAGYDRKLSETVNWILMLWSH